MLSGSLVSLETMLCIGFLPEPVLSEVEGVEMTQIGFLSDPKAYPSFVFEPTLPDHKKSPGEFPRGFGVSVKTLTD
jgi:hypothetical protein